MIQKHISLPEELDRKIRGRAKRLRESEERVITTLLEEEGLKKPKAAVEKCRGCTQQFVRARYQRTERFGPKS